MSDHSGGAAGPSTAERSGALSADIRPQALRNHYQAFLTARDRRRDGRRMPRRILLTGHSHQAWPDVAETALLAAFRDAAVHVDDKWEAAFAVMATVARAIASRIGGQPAEYTFAGSTHELLVRFLSSLELRRRRHIVTTTGEFHSAHRQLRRLAEEGIEVTWVETTPVSTLPERLIAALRPDTAALIASTVLFETAEVVPGLAAVTVAAQARGAAVLYDAYHAFSALPFSLADLGPDPLFLVAGGYKYAQWGEGVCFLRVPPQIPLRPLYTGWFAAFSALADRRTDVEVSYPAESGARFAGSTFDPVSLYRAQAVCSFFDVQQLSVPALRRLSLSQTARLQRGLADLPGLSLATPIDPACRGGFVSVHTPHAARLVEALRDEGVYLDARGELLRLGPAPYVTNDEIDLAIELLRRALQAL